MHFTDSVMRIYRVCMQKARLTMRSRFNTIQLRCKSNGVFHVKSVFCLIVGDKSIVFRRGHRGCSLLSMRLRSPLMWTLNAKQIIGFYNCIRMLAISDSLSFSISSRIFRQRRRVHVHENRLFPPRGVQSGSERLHNGHSM